MRSAVANGEYGVGKPNPETFPIAKIAITLKGSDESTIILAESALRDALQYGLPGGHAELIQVCHLPNIAPRGLLQLMLSSSGSKGSRKKSTALAKTRVGVVALGTAARNLYTGHSRSSRISVTPSLLKRRCMCRYIPFCKGRCTDQQVLGQTSISVSLKPCLALCSLFPGADCHVRGVVGFLRADGHEFVEVTTSADGLDPFELEKILSEWPESRRRPTVLYTIPTGSNPTGRSCTDSRKAEMSVAVASSGTTFFVFCFFFGIH